MISPAICQARWRIKGTNLLPHPKEPLVRGMNIGGRRLGVKEEGSAAYG